MAPPGRLGPWFPRTAPRSQPHRGVFRLSHATVTLRMERPGKGLKRQLKSFTADCKKTAPAHSPYNLSSQRFTSGFRRRAPQRGTLLHLRLSWGERSGQNEQVPHPSRHLVDRGKPSVLRTLTFACSKKAAFFLQRIEAIYVDSVKGKANPVLRFLVTCHPPPWA